MTPATSSRAPLCGAMLALAGIMPPSGAPAQEDDSPAQARATEARRASVAASAGIEYDDNALRQAGEGARADALTRYLVSADGIFRHDQDTLALTFGQGGKLFLRERDADTLLTQLALSWRRQLHPDHEAGVTLDLKDRTERLSLQDYNRGGAAAVTRHRVWRLLAETQLGWRYFAYKPNPAASSWGPAAGAGLGVRLPANLSAQLRYQWLSRRFASGRRELVDPEQALMGIDEGTPRQDAFHSAKALLVWRGPLLVDVSYALSLNTSNSYGQDLTRHHVAATLNAPLPLGFLTSLKLDLQRTHYEDPVSLDANFRVDEDNRNALIVALSRPLSRRWEAQLRYSRYAQEFGAGEAYARQTLFLGVGYTRQGGGL